MTGSIRKGQTAIEAVRDGDSTFLAVSRCAYAKAAPATPILCSRLITIAASQVRATKLSPLDDGNYIMRRSGRR
jgi:hypothetical protein